MSGCGKLCVFGGAEVLNRIGRKPWSDGKLRDVLPAIFLFAMKAEDKARAALDGNKI
jgi:hypothetical protein